MRPSRIASPADGRGPERAGAMEDHEEHRHVSSSTNGKAFRLAQRIRTARNAHLARRSRARAGGPARGRSRASAAPRKAEAAPPRKATTPAPRIVEVAFVRNGRLTRVERVVPEKVAPEVHALRELVQGSTRVERRKGIRTAIPEGARVRSVRADGELWLASLSRSTFGAGAPQTKRTRLQQIAATLTPLGPQAYAVVATEGRLVDPSARHAARRLARRDRRERLSVPRARSPASPLDARLPRALGRHGDARLPDEQALLAFQGWRPRSDGHRHRSDAGRARRGVAPRAVSAPRRPSSRDPSRPGRAAHGRLGRRSRAVHASTGIGGLTPAGSFRVWRRRSSPGRSHSKCGCPTPPTSPAGSRRTSHPMPVVPRLSRLLRLPEGEAEGPPLRRGRDAGRRPEVGSLRRECGPLKTTRSERLS